MLRLVTMSMLGWMVGCTDDSVKTFEENADAQIAVNAADYPLAAYEQLTYLVSLLRGPCPVRTTEEDANYDFFYADAEGECVADSGLTWKGTVSIEDLSTFERVQRTVVANNFAVESEQFDNFSFDGELVLTGEDLNLLDILETENFTITINNTTLSYTEYELIGDVSELLREAPANVSIEAEVAHEGQTFSLGGSWDFAPDCQDEPAEGVLSATGNNQITVTLDGSDCDGCAAWQDTDRDNRNGNVCEIRTEVTHFFNEVGD